MRSWTKGLIGGRTWGLDVAAGRGAPHPARGGWQCPLVQYVHTPRLSGHWTSLCLLGPVMFDDVDEATPQSIVEQVWETVQDAA